MGRVREHIKINGKKFWTLFDTGARNTYVVPRVAAQLVKSKLHKPFRTALGGEIKQSRQSAILEGSVQGHRVSTLAMVIDDIGRDEEGKSIDILFGTLAMQNWGIRPIPDEEKLDLSHYPKEFVEFSCCRDPLSPTRPGSAPRERVSR
jgi:hypothetical protein